MPGKHITDQQMRNYMKDRRYYTQRAAAARSGFSERTARRIEARPVLPSQRKKRRGRTVPDPLAAVWQSICVPCLEKDCSLQAIPLLRHLQEVDPDGFPDDRVRRTLERRVREWKALYGPDRTAIFRQTAEPGRMGLSDFTDVTGLGVTIAGAPLDHRLYHFALAYSGWEYASPVLGGESFTALAENLQNALWTLGGAPSECRTDSLSAAYRNLNRDAARDITRRYEEFCRHYGMTASRNTPGEAHENGCIEAHNNHLKVALDQSLMMRDDRDFVTIADWRRYVDEFVARRNRRREDKVKIELPTLHPLPKRRTTDFTEHVVRVARTSGFHIHSVFYSAPSRLIGQRLRVHVYDDRIEAYLGSTHVLTHTRLRGRKNGSRVHCVNYRHIIHSLRRKPQALAGSVYRDSLFPTPEYSRAWESLYEALPRKQACRRMVDLLGLAHDENCESELAGLIASTLATGQLPEARVLHKRLARRTVAVPQTPVILTDLSSFDALLGAQA